MKNWLLFLCVSSMIFAKEEVVILGGGVGAMTAALYLGRAGIEPVVIEGDDPGGLITQSTSVQNWPGEMEITGTALAEKIRKQAIANGVTFYSEEVVSVDFSKKPFVINTKVLGEEKPRQWTADSVIIAMGTTPNFLGVPGEAEYWGKGITNCAICDGALHKNGKVAVVGGGDAAVLEALYLSNIAKEVTVFVRKGALKGIEEKRIRALRAKPNVKIVFNTTIEQMKGNGSKLTSIMVKTGDTPAIDFPIDGLFLAIGSKPNSQTFAGKLELDPQGYIFLKSDQETSIPGIYAVGDIVDPVYKQAITAAGDGAKAALQAERHLSDKK